MILQVHLFARARDLVGTSPVEVDLPGNATVADLRQRLATAYPRLAPLLPRSAVALNEEFADDRQPLSPATEIALLPPVSGGQEPTNACYA